MRISYHNRRIKILFIFILIIIVVLSLIEIGSRFSADVLEKVLNREYQGYKFQIRKCKYIPFKGLILLDVHIKKDNQRMVKAEKIVLNQLTKKRLVVELVSVHFGSGFLNFFPLGTRSKSARALDISIDEGYIGNEFRIRRGFISLNRGRANFLLDANYKFWDLNFSGYFAREGFLMLKSSAFKMRAFGIYFPDSGKFNGKLVFRDRICPLSFTAIMSPELIIQDISINGFKIRGPLRLQQMNNLESDWEFNSEDLNIKGKLQFENYPRKSLLCLRMDLIEYLKYEAGFNLTGFWGYSGELSLDGKFNEFSLSELLYIFLPRYQRVLSLSGITGRVVYFSFDDTKFAELYWEIPRGKIGDINFNDGKLHLVGKSSVMEFINSQLIVNDVPYFLEGKVDFSKFPSSETWKDVYLVGTPSTIPWGKLNLERHSEEKRISLGTKLSDIVRLDYNVEFSEQGDYNKNEVSLEIKGTPNLKLRLRGDEEIMGVEKKIEF
ncbi:MAG: hypothetical protein B6D53_01405 [Candidatus Omnitrophica bacterium 4484_49]|nr:MAG: hypothetical protein B6D53_01405 [Candidatus Omnitrophica bacterium 4484_49]